MIIGGARAAHSRIANKRKNNAIREYQRLTHACAIVRALDPVETSEPGSL